jgi:hypothetical protein
VVVTKKIVPDTHFFLFPKRHLLCQDDLIAADITPFSGALAKP